MHASGMLRDGVTTGSVDRAARIAHHHRTQLNCTSMIAPTTP
jgi:hypothetical protein